jgi:hypothetical protein
MAVSTLSGARRAPRALPLTLGRKKRIGRSADDASADRGDKFLGRSPVDQR